MKKIVSLFLVMLFILVGCSKPTSGIIKQENITLSMMEEKINNKETFAFSVSSKTCSHCKALKEFLNGYQANGTIYILETTDLSKEDIQKLIKRFPGLNSTPTTFFFNKGELEHTEVGYSKETITSRLDKFFK